LTTQHHCEVSTAGYNFLEFDIAGKVGHGQVWTSVCGRSLTTALKENGQPVHVQIPLDGCLSFYKLAFWPLITQTCVSENWVTIDNVTLTK